MRVDLKEIPCKHFRLRRSIALTALSRYEFTEVALSWSLFAVVTKARSHGGPSSERATVDSGDVERTVVSLPYLFYIITKSNELSIAGSRKLHPQEGNSNEEEESN